MKKCETKALRVKSAINIFDQIRKAGTISKEINSKTSVVDLSDISETGKYFDGFIFVSSVATYNYTLGRRTAAADAAHFEILMV